jgi:molybdate transport system substrate-binding protein
LNLRTGRTIALAGALMFAARAASAAELNVLVTGSMAQPLREIAESFARKDGHIVNVTPGITTTVIATLQAGEQADLVEVTSVGMDQLEREMLVAPGSRVPIASALIGIAVREGAPVRDISTAEAVIRVLREARSVAYVNPRFGGQVSVNLKTFLDRIGLADEVAKKAVLAFTGEEAVQKAARGEVDVVLAFVSEILPVKGVKWLGPLPAALQVPTDYSAAIGAGSAHPELARALLDDIRSETGRRIIREAGLEPAAPH